MKTFAILFALLVIGHCFNYKGYDVLSTLSDSSDPASCLLTLSIDSKTETALNFHQRGNLNECQYRNLIFNSFFRGDQLNDAVPFNAPVNGLLTASMDAAALQRNNGTACVKLAQSQYPYDFYVCHFTFSAIHIYLQVYGTGNFTYATSVDGLLITNFANQQIISPAYNSINLNSSFPAILVDLFSACNSNSNNITDLSTAVTVSTSVNLNANLNGMYLSHTVVRRANSFTPGDYLSIKSNSNAILFGDASVSSCYTLPIHYSDILPDLSYCSQGVGCKVSFVLTNSAGEFYLLQTNGVITTPASTGGNGNGNGNGNGSGNGNGGNGGVGNGNGNGGNGGSASSGMTMVFNIAALLLAAVYLA